MGRFLLSILQVCQAKNGDWLCRSCLRNCLSSRCSNANSIGRSNRRTCVVAWCLGKNKNTLRDSFWFPGHCSSSAGTLAYPPRVTKSDIYQLNLALRLPLLRRTVEVRIGVIGARQAHSTRPVCVGLMVRALEIEPLILCMSSGAGDEFELLTKLRAERKPRRNIVRTREPQKPTHLAGESQFIKAGVGFKCHH